MNTRRPTVRHLLHCTLASASCALGLGGAALAQSPTPASGQPRPPQAAANAEAGASPVGGLEEVTVTARKRVENLQEVPLTVTAITKDQIRRANIDSASDLAALTPGFVFEDLGSRQASKPIIRGLTTNSISPADQKNSSFIDGAYVSGTASSLPFIAFERVEILKGPQSAAFGRGTFGGAINYITKDPGESFEISAEVEAGTQETLAAGLEVSGTLIPGVLRGLAIGWFDTWGGDEDWETASGTSLGGRKTRFGMGKLVWSPTYWLEIEGKGIYAEFEDENAALSTLAPSQRNGVFRNSRFPVGVVTQSLRPFAYDESVYRDPKIELEKTRASLEARITLSGHLLTLAGSYDNEDGFQHLFDGAQRPCVTPGVNRGATATVCSAQNSEFRNTMFEVRIASTGDAALQYLAGVSYVDLRQRQFFFQPVTGSVFLPFHNGDFESLSAYGSVSYDVTSRLTLGFEARYNQDDGTFIRWGSCQPVSFTGAVNSAPCATAGDPFTGTPAARLGDSTAEFSAFLPRVTADYKLSDDILLYALYAEGNQPGNINSTPNVPPSLREVKEEDLTNYEVGLKTTLLDGRLLLNLAAYRMYWENQIFRRTVDVALSSGLTTTLPLNVNEGNSRVTGAELETRWRANERLELGGTLAFVKSRYERFCSEFGFTLTGQESRPGERCLDVDGNQLEGSPDWTASLSGTYTTPVTRDWNASLRADYFYTSTKYAEPLNLGETGDANVINLRLGLENDAWRFEVYGENVTNEDAPTRLASLVDATLGASAPGTGTQNLQPVLRQGAQYGIRVLVEF